MIRELKASDVTFTITAEPETDVAIRGSFASGDDAEDEAMVREIEAEVARGNVWAWACVTVTAHFGEWSESANLGACSYKSEEDFKEPEGYFEQMKADALESLNASLKKIDESLPR